MGTTSSVAYGHSLGCILAFAYVKPEAAVADTELEVVIMGEARKARILSAAVYDPEIHLPRSDA